MKENLKELFEEFISQQEYVKCLRPETLRGYRQVFETMMRIMPSITTPEEITTTALTEFYKRLETRTRIVGKNIEKKGVRKSTILTYRQKLRLFFEWLRIKGCLESNPFSGMPFPKVVYEDRRFLTKDQVSRILTGIISHPQRKLVAQKRDILMVSILLFCGLRKTEAQLLEVRDIDVGRKLLTVRGETSKSIKTRQIPLHSDIISNFKDYMKERSDYKTPFLFVSSGADRGLSTHGMKHWVNRVIKISGVRFHLHQFRHTFATNFLNSTHTNNNIVKLKELMGHKDIKMTQVYLRALPVDQMRADVEGMSIDTLM